MALDTPDPDPDEKDWDGVGKCHICREIKEVRFCPACNHFFCDDCRVKWWSRGLGAIKEMAGGRTPGCCYGPGNREE